MIKDDFVVWCHIYLPVSKWVTQQSYGASRGKAYMASCVQSCRNANLWWPFILLSINCRGLLRNGIGCGMNLTTRI
jgi:hypothetical protein